MSKQTKITIETFCLVILNQRNCRQAWCPDCAGEQEMIAVRDVAAASPVNALTVQACLNLHSLHRTHDAAGDLLICLKSLLGNVATPINALPALCGERPNKETK